MSTQMLSVIFTGDGGMLVSPTVVVGDYPPLHRSFYAAKLEDLPKAVASVLANEELLETSAKSATALGSAAKSSIPAYAPQSFLGAVSIKK